MRKSVFAFSAFAAFFFAGGGVGKARAYDEVVEVIRATATVTTVRCSTGTAIRLDTNAANGLMGTGYNRAGVRLYNQDSADAVYIGFDSQVTSFTATTSVRSFQGEEIKSGVSAPYSIGRDIALWCIAADAAGASGASVSVMQFGYR